VDETIRGEYDDLFLVGNKPIVRVKILVHCFFFELRRIVYHCLLEKHKDKIKMKIVQYNSKEYICLVFVFPIDPDHLNEIAREKSKSWAYIENSNFFLLRSQHIVMVIKCMLMQKLNYFFPKLNYVLIV
jgi:hypothetical protein